MVRCYEPDFETMPVSQINALQSERLVAQVAHVFQNVPYYRGLMEEKGLKPSDIKGRGRTFTSCPLPTKRTCGTPTPTACSPFP